jgi:hypothetical protein
VIAAGEGLIQAVGEVDQERGLNRSVGQAANRRPP